MSNAFEQLHASVENSKRLEEESRQKDRAGLFENETLVIKVLQAVSGASLVAGIAQSATLVKLAGNLSLLILMSAMVIGLLASVFAAHWKHQYKLWGVEANSTDVDDQRQKRKKYSARYLTAMRAALWIALLAVAAGFIQLLVFLWIVGIRTGI